MTATLHNHPSTCIGVRAKVARHLDAQVQVMVNLLGADGARLMLKQQLIKLGELGPTVTVIPIGCGER